MMRYPLEDLPFLFSNINNEINKFYLSHENLKGKERNRKLSKIVDKEKWLLKTPQASPIN